MIFSNENRRFGVFRGLPLVIVGIISIFCISLIAIKFQLRNTVDQETTRYVRDQLSIRNDMILDNLKENRASLRFLFATPPVDGIVRAQLNNGVDPATDNSIDQWLDRLQVIFTVFMENHADIAQIRFIGGAENGKELVRVERQSGNITIVPNEALQAKGERAYFQVAKELPPNTIYTSRIELNREFGEIQFPQWPTYRVITPVFSASGEFFGAVIINIDATSLLNSLRGNINPGLKFYLMNERGDFILHPKEEYQFQFEWGNPVTWADFFGDTLAMDDSHLNIVHGKKSGEILHYMGHRFPLNGDLSKGYLTAVLAAPEDFIESVVMKRLYGAITILLVVFALFVGAALYYHRMLTNKQKLIDARSLYQAIVSGSTDAIIVLNGSATITRWNEPAKAMLGYFESQILGRKLFDLFPDSENTNLSTTTLQRVLHGVRIDPIITQARCEDGSLLDVSVTLSPLATADNNSSGVTAIVRDISEQKALEKQIRNTNANLEKTVHTRTRELEEARNEALEASRAKSEFLAAMSHEIRTPMNGIFGMMNLLRQEPLSSQQEHYLDMAESSVSSLTGLINDILDMSKIEAGKLEIETFEFDLTALLHTCVSSMAIQAQVKSVEVVLDTAGISDPIVKGDANRVRQIITNLISNAIKFTDKGFIRVVAATQSAAEADIEFACSVEDTGIGISEESQSNLFQAFAQESSSTSRAFGGTGLGLSISQKLCHSMGGDISLVSTKGVGSTFSFHVVLEQAGNVRGYRYYVDLSDRLAEIYMDCRPAALAAGHIINAWGGTTHTADKSDFLSVAANTETPSIIIIDQEIFLSEQSLIKKRFQAETIKPCVLVARMLQSRKVDLCLGEGWNLASIDKPLSSVNLSNTLSVWFGNSNSPSDVVKERAEAIHDKQLTGAHVLVADDHAINQEVAGGLLRAMGVTVSFADDGEDVLSLLQAAHSDSRPDVILMDCQMPVLDGFQTTRSIRQGEAGEANREIPIIALTAGVMAGERERCLNAGMDDYLTKPINPAELTEALAKYYTSDESTEELAGDGELSPAGNWDRATTLKRLDNNEELLSRITEIYIRTTPDLMSELYQALSSADVERVGSLAHQLKGISENIGAVAISEICRLLEQDAKSHQPEHLSGRVDQLKIEYQKLVALLSSSQ